MENDKKYDISVNNKLSAASIFDFLDKIDKLSKTFKNSDKINKKIDEIKSLIKQDQKDIPNVLEKSATMEQQLHSPLHPAVKELENNLKMHGKSGKIHSDGFISELVKKIAEKNNISVNDLMQMFKEAQGNMTPAQYLRYAKEGSISESSKIENAIKDLHIMEMYETLKVGLGEKSWVAITKRLKTEGFDPTLVDKAVDAAIVKLSKAE
jgi:hypothetical protein